MTNWSNLTPNLSSWINAFLLAGLLIIATTIIPGIHYLWSLLFYFGSWLIYFLAVAVSFLVAALPQFIQYIIVGIFNLVLSIVSHMATLISPLILLLPIPMIAFAHHYLYLLLDRYYPDIASAERGRVTGYFPGLVSWWHGLYGLLVIILAMLISDSVLSILPWLSFDSLNCGLSSMSDMSEIEIFAGSRVGIWVRMALMILVQPIYSPVMRLIIWLIAAAYLYQFEFKVRQHLIATSE